MKKAYLYYFNVIFFFWGKGKYVVYWASQGALLVKTLPANLGDLRDMGSTPGEGNGNPLWYSCLKNLVGRGAWQATVHRVTKSQIWLKQLSTAYMLYIKHINQWHHNTIKLKIKEKCKTPLRNHDY